MCKKETDMKKTNAINNANNNEEFVIPNEAACSPEFSEGCIIAEDETDNELEEK